jgi:GNAT superfamily N-acetyltransferase
MKFEIRYFYGSEALPGIIELRYEVLRKPLGLSLEQSQFAGDELNTTVHIVGFVDNAMEACLTILLSENQQIGQLRGMAVSEEFRGHGLGSQLLEAAHEWAREKGVSLWCNARSQAVGFYSKHSWEVSGPEFTVANVGPHFPMVWKGTN